MDKYVVTGFGQPLQAMSDETPRPIGHEVVVRTCASGVCHTDIHVWEGYYDLGGGRRMNFADRGVKPPIVLGHEIAGEVVAAGPEAEVKIGDMVLVYPWIGCGSCPVCQTGDEHLCATPGYLGIFRPGGYADHVLVPHERYLLPIADMSPVQAAPLACSGLTAFSALKQIGSSRLSTGPIGIIGAGGLGLMCLSLLRAMGGRGAVVVDINEANRAAASAAGALAVIDGASESALTDAKAATGGPVSAVIDFVGGPQTAQLAIDWVGKGGKVIIIGLYGGELRVALPTLPLRAVTIAGSFVGGLPDLEELVALAIAGGVPSIPIVECELCDANEALHALKAGKRVGRTVLRPSRTPVCTSA